MTSSTQIVGSQTTVSPAPLGQGVTSAAMSKLMSLVDFVKSDLAKLVRYAAVAFIMVPIGLALFWVFLEVIELRPILANVAATAIATVPNYILNRYWVWNKRGANSVKREIAPFWAMAFLGVLVSTVAVAIAEQFTDISFVFLAVNFCAFGLVWVLKFFVLEKYLFGNTPDEMTS